MSKRARAGSGLRGIVAPFVVALPKGVRIRTRVRLTTFEESAVERIGVFLGGPYRATLADRLALGRASMTQQATWRRTHKQALTAATSSRWAGAITRTAQDSYDLGMRALDSHVIGLAAATTAIGARMDAPVGGHGEAGRPGVRTVTSRMRPAVLLSQCR